MARMRALFGVLAALHFATVGEAQAISTTSVGSSLTVSSTTYTLGPSQSASTTSSAPVTSGTIIVDAAGSGQFTAINPAISYAQTFAQPTVIVRAGTYNEAVTVFGTAAVTIIGDSPTPTNYTKNQVTILSNIAASIPMSIGTNGVLGITWRNINSVNSTTGTAAELWLFVTRDCC